MTNKKTDNGNDSRKSDSISKTSFACSFLEESQGPEVVQVEDAFGVAVGGGDDE